MSINKSMDVSMVFFKFILHKINNKNKFDKSDILSTVVNYERT